MMKRICLAFLLIALLQTSVAQAQTKTALGALAVSPDNKTLVAAGFNRVMYLCDPADLTVKERVYLKIAPSEIAFSNDGKSLIVFSSDRNIVVFDTENWQRKAEIEGAKDMAIASEANQFVVMHSTKYRDGKRFSPVSIHDMSTGEKVRGATFEMDGTAIGTNCDATQIVLLSAQREDKSETKERAPSELENLERDEFEQRHDGRVSDVIWLTGELKEAARHVSYYGQYGAHKFLVKDDVAHFISYGNKCASFTKDGETKMFRTGISFNYGIGISPDQKTIASGGRATGMVMDAEKMTSVTFDHSRLPGGAEYLYGFTFGPDGTIYGGTSAWRVIKVSAEGEVLDEKPIF